MPLFTADGPLTGNSIITIATTGCGILGFEAAGTWTGTLHIEGTYGSQWLPVKDVTANDAETLIIVGYRVVRVRAQSVTGIANIFLTASDAAPDPVEIASGGFTIGKVDQGESNSTAAKAWIVRQSDGSSLITPAKDSTLTDGSQKTQVTNFPSSYPVTNAGLSNLDVALSTVAKDATLTSGSAKVQVTSLPAISGTVSVSNFPSTYAITNANLDVALSTLAKASTQTDGSQKTQVTNFPSTYPVTNAGLSNLDVALSTVAKASTQTDGSQKTQVTSLPAISGSVALTASLGPTPTNDPMTFVDLGSTQTLWANTPTSMGRSVYNPSGNGDLFLRYGTTNPTGEADCTRRIPGGLWWEMPFNPQTGRPEWTGEVRAILTAGATTKVNRVELIP